MMEETPEYFQVIKPEEWMALMKGQMKDLYTLKIKYGKELMKNPDNLFPSQKIKELDNALYLNDNFIKQAEIERPYMVFYLDRLGTLCFRRIGKEMASRIYNREMLYII